MIIEFKPHDVEMMRFALDTWGLDAQVDQTVEECAELIVALHKHTKRSGVGNNTRFNMLDEIADVEMMLAQMRVAFDISDTELQEHLRKKFLKLQEYLTQ